MTAPPPGPRRRGSPARAAVLHALGDAVAHTAWRMGMFVGRPAFIRLPPYRARPKRDR